MAFNLIAWRRRRTNKSSNRIIIASKWHMSHKPSDYDDDDEEEWSSCFLFLLPPICWSRFSCCSNHRTLDKNEKEQKKQQLVKNNTLIAYQFNLFSSLQLLIGMKKALWIDCPDAFWKRKVSQPCFLLIDKKSKQKIHCRSSSSSWKIKTIIKLYYFQIIY